MVCLCESEKKPSLNICPNPPSSHLQPSAMASTLSMSGPITKVVKNDAYTAPPRPPVPVAPTRPTSHTSHTSHMAASRAPPAALQPVSRTLQQNTAEASTTAATPPQVRHPPQIWARHSFSSRIGRSYRRVHVVFYLLKVIVFIFIFFR